jgi:hypothetical protein
LLQCTPLPQIQNSSGAEIALYPLHNLITKIYGAISALNVIEFGGAGCTEAKTFLLRIGIVYIWLRVGARYPIFSRFTFVQHVLSGRELILMDFIVKKHFTVVMVL